MDRHPLEKAVKERLQEAFEGPALPAKESWFTNTEPNSGIFGAIEGISAEGASMSIHGTTLAAHIDHMRYHMWGTNELLEKGEFPKMDWNASWKIQSVDAAEWSRIQEGLRSEYSILIKAVDHVQWNENLANELLGSLAHSAYHLGAIKQISKAIQKA